MLEELEQEKDKVAELRKHMDRMAEDLVQLEALKGQVVYHKFKIKITEICCMSYFILKNYSHC